MNLGAAAQLPDMALVSQAVEHAMMISGDEVLVAQIASCPKERRPELLGRILYSSNASIKAGTPLMAWAGGGKVLPSWREECSVVEGSLYGQMMMLRELTDSRLPEECGAFFEWETRSTDFDLMLETA